MGGATGYGRLLDFFEGGGPGRRCIKRRETEKKAKHLKFIYLNCFMERN